MKIIYPHLFNTTRMSTKPLPPKLRQLLALVLVLFAFQSCTKQDELVSPSATSSSDATVSQTPSTPLAPCRQVCLVAGQTMYVGNVGVAMDNGGLQVTYNITKPNVYLQEVHFDIFTSLDDFRDAKKLSNGGAVPGQFQFKKTWSTNEHVTTYTATIPKEYVDKFKSDEFYVATHAALSNGETAWGGLCTEVGSKVSLDVAKQFPGKNWGVYFAFDKDECTETIDFTYAWEDQIFEGNDKDYNDLVVQSDVTKLANELKINFLFTARGAAYDHKFRFKIPKAGVTDIYGNGFNITYTSDATYYYVTVLGSTKDVLPGTYSNTQQGSCVPFASRMVVLTLDSKFKYDKAKPYEPFITVFPSGSVNSGSSYDLYLYEVSGRDTWKDSNGAVYPNGILIPLDWRWPLETVAITNPYPDFKPITGGVFTTGWWINNTNVNDNNTYNKALCK